MREGNNFLKNILRLPIGGLYDSKTNKIIIYNKSNCTIYHELFHMAGQVLDEPNRGGFHSHGLGLGLDELYTDYMVRKYFDEPHPLDGTTYFEKRMSWAENLDKIVGKEEMEKCYLMANLNQLLVHLNEKTSETNVFIANLDYLYSKYGRPSNLGSEIICNDVVKEVDKFFDNLLLLEKNKNEVAYER